MAQYRVNDVVSFNVEGNYVGLIESIIADKEIDVHAVDDLYRVRILTHGAVYGVSMPIYNKNITGFIGTADELRRRNVLPGIEIPKEVKKALPKYAPGNLNKGVFKEMMEKFAELENEDKIAARRLREMELAKEFFQNAIKPVAPGNEIGDVKDEEVKEEEKPIIYNYKANLDLHPKPLEVYPIDHPIPAIKEEEDEEAEEVDNNLNPRNYEAINDTFPEYVLRIKGNYYPVYDHKKVKQALGLTEYHYKMNIKIAKRLYIFTYDDGKKIHPCYDRFIDYLYFKNEDGVVVVNQYQHKEILKLDGRFRDTIGQNWCTEEKLVKYRMDNGIHGGVNPANFPPPKNKPRRKLRKKYKEMPKIKEAKYYESNDYVA